MGTENHSKPAQARFRVEYRSGKGYFVQDAAGARVSSYFAREDPALTARDGAQKTWDAKHKRKPRPCLCCGRVFQSEGVHNRLCASCRQRGDGGSMAITAASSGRVRRLART